jgi:hypothetical protein
VDGNSVGCGTLTIREEEIRLADGSEKLSQSPEILLAGSRKTCILAVGIIAL